MKNKFKTNLCNAIVDDYCRKKNISRENLNASDSDSRGTLGVAMEYLGMTDKWTQGDFDYIDTRCGVIANYISADGEPFVLTLRDILEN